MIQYIQSKGWKRVYIWLFLTTPFLLFILEEGIQTLGFGRFTLAQGKLWEEALEAVQVDKKINSVCFIISILCFPVNPLAGGVFTLYFWADKQKILREVVRYETELFGYSNHTVSEPNAFVTAIQNTGSRKLALLVIGITLSLIILLHYHQNRKPVRRKEPVFIWSKSDLETAASQIGINQENLFIFFESNQIPTEGKEKTK